MPKGESLFELAECASTRCACVPFDSTDHDPMASSLLWLDELNSPALMKVIVREAN